MNLGIDEESLVRSKQPTSSSPGPTCSSKWQRLVGLIILGCFLLFLWDSLEWNNTPTEEDVQVKNTPAQVFIAPPLTSAKTMLDRLIQVRQDWIDQKLKKDYGEEYYYDIFEPKDEQGERVSVGKHRAFVDPNRLPLPGRNYVDYKNSDGPAWDKMVRKWTIKLLQIQLDMLQAAVEETIPVNSHHRSSKASPKRLHAQFLWVNGGHSASAGHGNFFRDSYTAVLERDLQPTLKEIGLDFRAKNYAMGGTESGEELALCFNSIFGKDVDQITWDFGMTDGGEHNKFILYAYNAARLAMLKDELTQPGNVPHRPAMLVLHHNDEMHPVLQTIQNLGMTVLAMDTRFQGDHMYPGFPEMLGKTDEEIAAVPTFSQYFKCNDAVEAGEPGCEDHKYNMTLCTEREGRASWHPGFRYHALMGHTMALTVLEVILEALHTLVDMEPSDTETAEEKYARLWVQLQKLDEEEQRDYNNMHLTPIPVELKVFFDDFMWKGDQKDANKAAMKDLGLIDRFVRDFTFCHTAILPAEIRYRGLLTENFNETGSSIDETYENGTLLSKLLALESPPEDGNASFFFLNPRAGRGNQMLIGTNDEEYEYCEVPLASDHKDFFFISSQEGWRSLSFPNDAEKGYYKEFSFDKSPKIIFFCTQNCNWGDCESGDIRNNIMDGSLDGIEYGRLEMEVNGLRVSSVKCLSKCCALQHEDPDPTTQFKWTPNADGKFDFRTRITGATKYAYVRFSSFIVA